MKGNISLVLVIYTDIEFLLLLWNGFYDYTSTTFEQSSHFISSTKNLNNGSVIIITLLSTKWCLLSMIFYVQRTNFRYFLLCLLIGEIISANTKSHRNRLYIAWCIFIDEVWPKANCYKRGWKRNTPNSHVIEWFIHVGNILWDTVNNQDLIAVAPQKMNITNEFETTTSLNLSLTLCFCRYTLHLVIFCCFDVIWCI